MIKMLRNIFCKPKQEPPPHLERSYVHYSRANEYLRDEDDDTTITVPRLLMQISDLAGSTNQEEIEIEGKEKVISETAMSCSFTSTSHIRLHHVVSLCRQLTKQIGIQRVIESSSFCVNNGFNAGVRVGNNGTEVLFVVPLAYRGVCVRFDASIAAIIGESEPEYVLTVSKKLRSE